MLFAIGEFLALLFQQFFLAGYVSNSYVFPKPLSSADEQMYIERYKNGDEDARNILIEHNLRLVAHISKKYAPALGKDNDDLISIGTIGLIKAISSFDNTKGIRLATYAARCIQNEILMVMRSGKKEQKEVSLNDPIGMDKEGNCISLMDVIYAEDDDVADSISLKMQVKSLYEAMSNVLKRREKLVLQLRYGLCNTAVKTQREIADMLGISRSYVSRIETKAIKKLSGAIKSEY